LVTSKCLQAMASYPSNHPYWMERVSAAIEQADAEHLAADQQLEDAQRLAAQRHRDADAKLAEIIREITAERRAVVEQEPDGETTAPNLKPVTMKRQSKPTHTAETQEKSFTGLLEEDADAGDIMNLLFSTPRQGETENILDQQPTTPPEAEAEQVMNQLLTTPFQCAEQSQGSHQFGVTVPTASSDKTEMNSPSNSERQAPTKIKIRKQSQAQREDPVGYAYKVLHSLRWNTKDHGTEESLQILATMWKDIVEMRDADPDEFMIRQPPAGISKKVVTEERRAAARTITQPLERYSDSFLLSFQLSIEDAFEWRQQWDIMNYCILL